ncbi:putative neutral sphingomyelinase isoform X2 [Dysidea avara]
MMKEITGDLLPYSHMFYSSVIGSGLCVFSRYQIVCSCFHQFVASGGVFDLFTGELFAGKGVGMCRLKISDDCYVSVYNIHTNPDFRESQLFECMQFVHHTRGNDLVVLCGDLNTWPNQPALKLLTTCMELQDPFYHEDCSYTSCPACEDSYTCNRIDNMYKSRGSMPERIDYVMYSDLKSNWVFAKRKFNITMEGLIPGKTFNYSDHVGVNVLLGVQHREEVATTTEIQFNSENKQAVFREVRSLLAERTSTLKQLYFSHSRLIYSWIFLLLLMVIVSIAITYYLVSFVLQAVLFSFLWLVIGRNVIGSLVALGQLSGQQNVLSDLHYYMT